MEFVTLANGFQYSTTTFDLIAEAELLEAKIAGDVHWMGKWKIGGRAYWYRECAKSQLRHEHRIFSWVNGFAICTCGLTKEDVSKSEQLLTAPGHIDVKTKELEMFYVIYQELDEDKGRMVCFCQTCGSIEPVPRKYVEKFGVVPLDRFLQLREVHVCGSQAATAS